MIRTVLLKIFGLKTYLKIISSLYICGVSRNMWQSKYPELFYLDTILKPGDTCIDIGANLGYYSTRMARNIGKTGKVYAVEPIPLFGEIWKRNMRSFSNAELLPFALGEHTDTVQMGIPIKDGRLHHGMTKITSSAQENYSKLFDVPMRNPDELFAHVEKLDFVKCDVEGYEFHVFSNFTETLTRLKPLVQSELSGTENRTKVIALFESLGYKTHILRNGNLQNISLAEALLVEQDFYFRHETQDF
ncbi:MAG: FkbM family methyltransferase [Bacteroidales bacterium]|jgi:FkbM family methyltransferase|nr:FkbM family methyltransferase [Bacteroidales bacterium]